MKYLRQFAIILCISFLGELLHIFIPLPIPASVYGLVLMLTALCTGRLKSEQVKETSAFLIEIMPVMFIPAAAGLLDSWPSLNSYHLTYHRNCDGGDGLDNSAPPPQIKKRPKSGQDKPLPEYEVRQINNSERIKH